MVAGIPLYLGPVEKPAMYVAIQIFLLLKFCAYIEGTEGPRGPNGRHIPCKEWYAGSTPVGASSFLLPMLSNYIGY